MRKLLGLVVLVIVAILAIAQFGPSTLLSEETTRRRLPARAGVFRDFRLAEFAAADHGKPPRQGRAGSVLDLFLHQLPAHAALRHQMARAIQGQRSCRGRRAHARIRLREGARQCRDRDQAPGHPLSGGAGQSVSHLARLRKSVLAGRVSDRQVGHHRHDAVRRRWLSANGKRHSASCRRAHAHRASERSGSERRRNARDVSWFGEE